VSSARAQKIPLRVLVASVRRRDPVNSVAWVAMAKLGGDQY
jgi:hypothetical protein